MFGFQQFQFDSRLLPGIRAAGYQQPTPIQAAAIPPALKGHDLIATAQTGTGKTAAFVLPMLQRLLAHSGKNPHALIITPTRELAEQIHQSIKILGSGTKLRSLSIYGGVSSGPQVTALQRGVEIIVACPGRLLDLLKQQHLSLAQVEFLVLDEADRMLDMGFLPDIKRILQRMPARRQTMLFSATFPKEIEALAAETTHNPQRVAIGISRPAHTVEHALFPVAQHLKKSLLIHLLEETNADSVLIFTRTKHRAQRLARQIEHSGYKVTSLHGNRSQGQRSSALSGFKQGKFEIMVATDIAARGLDIERISHVINFDMPDTVDAYIHRIGRTGRAQQSGLAFTLLTPDDEPLVKKIEKIMQQKLPRRTLSGFAYDAPKPVTSAPVRRPTAEKSRPRSPNQTRRPVRSR